MVSETGFTVLLSFTPFRVNVTLLSKRQVTQSLCVSVSSIFSAVLQNLISGA